VPVVATPERGERQEAILAAALDCFTERGFAATTIEEIRKRSGASIGSIYHHFGGKEGLAAELYVEGLRGYQVGFIAALERRSDPEAAVRALVRHHLRWVEGNPKLAKFLMNRRETELRLATKARVRELNRDFFPRVEAWMERHVGSGALRAVPADLWEPLLLGPSQEFTRLWLAGRTRISLSRAERELAEATWNALRGDLVQRRASAISRRASGSNSAPR
jgi:AcrR family transcriptional regulator